MQSSSRIIRDSVKENAQSHADKTDAAHPKFDL
jgi:hypothetical protein